MKIKRYLTLLIIIIIIFQAKHIITNIQTSDLNYIKCDTIFSNDLSSEIKDFINKLKNQKPAVLFKQLKDKYPMIKSIIISRKNPELLLFQIFGHTPIYLINGNLVFTEDNKISSKYFYIYETLNNLENIINNEAITNDFINFVSNIPKYIISEFKVIWQNRHLIYLKSKIDEKLTILIIHNLIPDEKKIEQCKKIKLMSQDAKKRQGEFTADLRFSNQIIISKN